MRRFPDSACLVAAFAAGLCSIAATRSESDTIRDNLHLRYGVAGPRCRVLDKRHFIINYEDRWRIAYWSAYLLTPGLLEGTAPRRNRFRPDPEVPEGTRSTLDDYKGSIFDRGHLAPAADFTRSREAMSTTFLLSNISPQYPNTNQGIWRDLENQIRSLARGMDSTWVVTGNLFMSRDSQPADPRLWITRRGRNRVAVPTHLFDAILAKDAAGRWCAYAFLVPNQSARNPNPTVAYRVSVDRLEELTGFDFFVRLDRATQERIESEIPAWPW